MLKKMWRSVCDSFRTDVYPPRPVRKQYLTDSERQAIMLTAEGNVYLAMGAVCTDEEVRDMKREVLDYARRHVQC